MRTPLPAFSSGLRIQGPFRTGLACIGLLVAGLVLRLIAIDSRGLWGDEAWRVWAARLPAAADVIHVAWAQPPSAPLYWLALHGWIRLCGHGDLAVRLFSVIPSVATLAAICWLGRLLRGTGTGLIAAVLLALSPMAVEVGQEATPYAWAMLAATLALAAGWSWLRTGHGAVRYLACGVFLVYTHYLGPLLLAWFFLAGLMAHGDPNRFGTAPKLPLRLWIRWHALMAAVWLPWAIAMVMRIAERWPELSRLRHRFGMTELYSAVAHWVLSASPQTFWPRPWVAIVVACACLFLAWALWRTRSGSPAWLFCGIAVGTIGTLAGTSALTGAWLFQPRFLTLVMPLLLLVLALGIGTPVSNARQRLLRFGLTALWLSAQITGLLSFYNQPVHGRDGLREIGSFLTSAVAPGDAVVGNYPMLLWSVAQYYPGRLDGLPEDWDVRLGYPLLPPAQPSWVLDQQAALPGIAGRAERLWLLYLPIVDPQGTLLASMQTRYRMEVERSYPILTIHLFTRRTP